MGGDGSFVLSFGYTPPPRKAIYQALFTLVSGATLQGAGGSPAFKTTSRKLTSWSQVASEEKPALYQIQIDEDPRTSEGGIPYANRMRVELYLFVNQPDDTVPTSDQLSDLVDAVFGALQPQVTDELQTLGGLVQNVKVSGKVEYREGLLGPNAFAVIPIEIFTGGLQPD